MTYETQAAHIARGEPLPIPEEITCIAGFSPTMLFRKEDSSGAHSYCGQYQLTVSDSASTEEVMALLPDTLPIEVEFHKDRESFADCTIDCPVSWKPLSLSGLRAGESITIWNAAEELLIPAGTSLCTPMGTFTLEEPLGIVSESWMSDEVVLILNVVAEGAHPTGVLSGSIHGLEMAFDLKPTGAAAIRAYTLTDGDSEWKELPGLPLLDAVNAQPATANSGYTTILSAEQEPFRSYLADEYAGEEPTPFLVRLTIEGGVYDDCQLILAYPDTYDFPPDLRVDGAGGNQGNAGTGNRDDSTEEGQRPNLPQTPVDEMTEQQASILADETDNSGNPTDTTGNVQTDASQIPAGISGKQQTGTSPIPVDNAKIMQTDNTGSRQTGTADHPADSAENKQTNAAERSSDNAGNRQADTAERSTNHTQNLQSNTAMPAPAITQTSADESKERPLNPVLPVAAASIAGIYITIMVTKIIAGMKAGGITIKKP